MEKTLVIIKPDAFAAGVSGEILGIFLKQGFRIHALKALHLVKREAEAFYQEHKQKFFFEGLIEFMISGPIITVVLAKGNAIHDARKLMGVTDSKMSAPGTIRAIYGQDNRRNAVHGSDSPESAVREISFFFSAIELLPDE